MTPNNEKYPLFLADIFLHTMDMDGGHIPMKKAFFGCKNTNFTFLRKFHAKNLEVPKIVHIFA